MQRSADFVVLDALWLFRALEQALTSAEQADPATVMLSYFNRDGQ